MSNYVKSALTRAQLEQERANVVLNFGVTHCPHCVVGNNLAGQAGLTSVMIEDGPGRKLGRTYGVKLWPTFIALKDGVEVARIVRPTKLSDLTPLLNV